MSLLLDTCVVLWIVNNEPQNISRAARDALEEATDIYVSALTAWEIAIKTSTGKLVGTEQLLGRYPAVLEASNMLELPFDSAAAIVAGKLRSTTGHKDPFDCGIAAQAIVGGLTLVTADQALLQLPVPALW